MLIEFIKEIEDYHIFPNLYFLCPFILFDPRFPITRNIDFIRKFVS